MSMMWKEAAAMTAVAGAACLIRSEYEKRHFSIEVTEISSQKLKKDRSLIFLSDLHNNEFGRDNIELVEAIHRLRPDAILSGGDMMVCKGEQDVKVPLKLFRQLAACYPVYCGNGNHENRMVWERGIYGSLYQEYRDAMISMGVRYLEDSTAALGEDILITGVDLDACFYRKALYEKVPVMPGGYLDHKLGRGPAKKDHGRYSILLAHSPLYFDSYAGWGADLTLAGHFHGGTVRIPGIGGVMTPQYQFFLPWCAGDFEENGKRMIVSRGLGTHSINIRLNNKPQLILIRLRSGEGTSPGNKSRTVIS